MKRVYLDQLKDLAAMSQVLHLALHALRRSPLQIKAADLCRMMALHSPEITRMRLLHRRPQYLPFVNIRTLNRVLALIFRTFPTMVIWEQPDGSLKVRLYKYYEGKRLPRSAVQFRRMATTPKRALRPGTTRWFLLQEMHQE